MSYSTRKGGGGRGNVGKTMGGAMGSSSQSGANSIHYRGRGGHRSIRPNTSGQRQESASPWAEDYEGRTGTAIFTQLQPHSSQQGEDASLFEAQAEAKTIDAIDEIMGFDRYKDGTEREGWMVNMSPTLFKEDDSSNGHAGLDLYFLEDDGGRFKATILFEPYFLLICKEGSYGDVEDYIRKKFDKELASLTRLEKEDLDLPNHLLSHKRTALKLSFQNMHQFQTVRRFLLPFIERNKKQHSAAALYENYDDKQGKQTAKRPRHSSEALESIVELREYDIMYYVRAAIDLDLRVGLWYSVKVVQGNAIIKHLPAKVKRADPIVFAFDIETTKLPLKFPDASYDSIMMISYMIDNQGFLITNREIVSEDISDFEYSPKPEFPGPFCIFNEENELMLLKRFYSHIRESKPTVFVTYNGDFFDWPFIDARSMFHGLSMKEEIGFSMNLGKEYKSSYGIHMDCFCWVKRDSYLPQGSQGLKAVTTAKLGYNPAEIDPEDMTRFASEQPQVLSQYSVSDAVATYYLYMKYVNPFIFSLCNIIPMNPDDVLRRGSGTLCENLLMVQAFKANVLMPNKHVADIGKLFEGHLLESETYVGGHVEALEAGVFRNDLPTQFKVSPAACQQLIDEVDQALQFSIVVESGKKLEDVVNYDEVRQSILEKLEDLRDNPSRKETPLIYHLDVAAMYPNIILTNRLQPDAIVDEEDCAACDFYLGPDSGCQRTMEWSWRGEFFPAKRNEYRMILNQVEQEMFPGKFPTDSVRPFSELTPLEQSVHVKKRVSDYSRKIYSKIHETKVVQKNSIVCQRENSFYVDTVRNFRDRRYEYKHLLKNWKKKLEAFADEGNLIGTDEAKKMVVVYDSLQLAHKCILNSFYGYVMRKGARWYSMEMAGIVCLTGSKIIQLARSRVEQIGRPLELDTDGIWCILPKSFPENFKFTLKDGKGLSISYPCVMLNHLVHASFTNDQYQTLSPSNPLEYETRSENSIFFEVDGPYRAMILPASTEEDKLLKKRYAVFEQDGSLAELKGFEIKRRGELKLIKIFQSQIFQVFLAGGTLEECYGAVANVADQWLDVLYSKGADLEDSELFDLISENRSMSKSLADYGAQKSTSISTAKRLAEFLGDQMVKDKGLNCKFIISEKPHGLPVSERAVPVVIFQAEESVKRHFLRKWLGDKSMQSFDIREIIDWKYYLERFGSVIQKLITIPAAMQEVSNPVPRVKHPEWLAKRVALLLGKVKQFKITDSFKAVSHDEHISATGLNEPVLRDMEDQGGSVKKFGMTGPVVHRNSKRSSTEVDVNLLPLPNLNTDYVGWLEVQKLKWRKLREERQEIKKRFPGSSVIAKNRNLTGMSSFLFKQSQMILNSTLELLSISQTDSPGEFKLWVLVNGNLHSFRLIVPRILYLNSRYGHHDESLDKPGVQMALVTKTLPRSHASYHLYEMSMSETTYQNNLGTFSTVFNHQLIEGVYESQVPLLIRALMRLGCAFKVAPKRALSSRGLEDGFELHELLHSPAPKYLSTAMNYVFLYHAKTGSRQCFGLFYQDKLSCFIVDAGMNQDAIPNLSKLYARSFTPEINVSADRMMVYPEMLDCSVSLFKTSGEAMSALNKALVDYQALKLGPTILTLQSSSSSRHLILDGLLLLNDFPLMSLPAHQLDDSFPVLGWQSYCCRRMLENFLSVGEFLTSRRNLARYADIPICNFESDYTLFMSDIFFARKLSRAGLVLWWSASDSADLGGREKHFLSKASEIESYPEINNPGLYSYITVEIDIWDLALNTLLQPSSFEDQSLQAEGKTGWSSNSGDSATSNDKDSKSLMSHQIAGMGAALDESKVNNSALRVLKDLVKSWSTQVSAGSVYASHCLEHLYRWLTSPSSQLYDDSVSALIHSLMHRIFSHLLYELKRLGCKIVYASYQKLVVGTSKTDIFTGLNYCKFVLASICKREPFEHIELRPCAFWEYLLWMDPYNFGGLVVENWDTPAENDGTKAKDQRIQMLDRVETSVDMEWNIGEYLPELAHEKFLRVIAEYIYEIRQYRKSGRAETGLVSYIKSFLSQNFKQRLFEVIGELMKTDSKSEFPFLPGSFLSLTRPTLEFVKFICAVFDLDPNLERENRLLKRDLLNLIGVREFSEGATFINPCEPFRLTRVICSFCNYCRDLDLTRDKDLIISDQSDVVSSETGGEGQSSNITWRCRACEAEYDKAAIEQRLLDMVQKLLCSWQTQDIKCTRCRQVRAEYLGEHCAECSGQLAPVLSKEDCIRKMTVLKNLSVFHGMEMLNEVVEWTLSMESNVQ